MSDRRLRTASVILAAAGALISGYLLLVRETGATLVCATGGCETVQSSAYAKVLGVPVSAIGLIGFLAMIGAAGARGERARLSQATLALSAFLFGAYLVIIQLAVIGALCQWCLASDVITTALATFALLRLREPAAPIRAQREIPHPKKRRNSRGKAKRPRVPPTRLR